MAQEITLNASLNVNKGFLQLQRFINSLQVTMTGTTAASGVVSIPTTSTGTALTLTGSGAGGQGYWRNTDATNFIEIGVNVSGTFYPVVNIPAGGVALFPIAATTLYARANTAAVILDFVALAA